VRGRSRLDRHGLRLVAGLIVLLAAAACGGGGDEGAAPDTTPPQVSSTSPTGGATGVTLNSSVSATFSEPMTNATLATANFTLATTVEGAAVTGTVSVSGNTATFTPSAPLAGSTLYTATITTAAKDAAGNALAANYSWNFTTLVANTGLEFPRNDQVPDGQTVRFKFTDPHTRGLPIYGPGGDGVTYILKVHPKQQTGYYTTFFWGNDDGQGMIVPTFLWTNGFRDPDTYYGAHPYPDSESSSGTTHSWEISVQSTDIRNGAVVYDRWYTQALRVWSDASGGKHHEFYWDLPNTDSNHLVTYSALPPPNYGETNPPAPALTFGDAPWAPGQELCSCILRGIQIYSSLLSLEDIQNEISSPLSTVAGSASIWYLNLNPTPDDILDKSGRGNHPDWVGDLRPGLWSE
jgi:hypothetical protein